MTHSDILRVVVDSKEGDMRLLVADDGRSFSIPVKQLPRGCGSEGAVLDVPFESGRLAWHAAVRNKAEEAARRSKAGEMLKELRTRDPGGDIEL